MDVKSLKKINDFEWEIPMAGDMNAPGKIFADKKLIEEMDEKVREQVTNVACLPGIQKAAMAMSDAHWGYGFPIGGVGAFDPEEGGVICMGGIGFDISCGVRTLLTDLTREELEGKKKQIADALFEIVPAGLGSHGDIKLNFTQLDELMLGGAEWAIEKGFGYKEDLKFIEENGKVGGANPSALSDMAKKRQLKEVGTLGSGNHYLEIQYINEIFDERAAKAYGLEKGKVIASFHCGSRALGHQVGTDYLKSLAIAAQKYKINVKDRELVCAPIKSQEGEQFFSAVAAAINCALANRQAIAHLIRQGFEKVFPNANVRMFYDVSHNTCKIEKHKVDGKTKTLYVHRKGATRSFGPGRPELPKEYYDIGQPVLIGGTMGTQSYILSGTETADEKAFASACHGAGRSMSRTQAKRQWYGENLIKDLEKRGILIKAHSFSGVAEEAPGAYKDVIAVVEAIHNAGLAKKVAASKPLVSIKG